MADPSPFGETSFRAIVRAICDADPANVCAGGCVESVLTLLTQRRCGRFFAMAWTPVPWRVTRVENGRRRRGLATPSAPVRVLDPIADAPERLSPADSSPRPAPESCRWRGDDSACRIHADSPPHRRHARGTWAAQWERVRCRSGARRVAWAA